LSLLGSFKFAIIVIYFLVWFYVYFVYVCVIYTFYFLPQYILFAAMPAFNMFEKFSFKCYSFLEKSSEKSGDWKSLLEICTLVLMVDMYFLILYCLVWMQCSRLKKLQAICICLSVGYRAPHLKTKRCTGWARKNVALYFCPYFRQLLIDFQNSFTGTLCKQQQ